MKEVDFSEAVFKVIVASGAFSSADAAPALIEALGGSSSSVIV